MGYWLAGGGVTACDRSDCPVSEPAPTIPKVQANCTRCHDLNLITNSWDYTRDGWSDRIAAMVKLPAPELETIASFRR
jgi:hypothetical protein